MKNVAVIPVKAVSERVESKNFKEFVNGESLFQLLLKQLKDSGSFDQIYVSSNYEEIREDLETQGIKYISRPEEYCNNDVPWSDVIAYVAESIPEEPDTVLSWCHTTSPCFNGYKKAVEKYAEALDQGHDGLVSVIKSGDFIISEKLQPLNYSWGPWHKYSQYLDKYFYITGALFMSSKAEMVKNRYVISKNPFLFEVTPYESIDIDNEYDFELAKILIKHKDKLSKYD